MDTVIFTGHVPIDEYKEDRQREFEELKQTDTLKDMVVKKDIPASWIKFVKTFGFIFLSLGIILIILIIYSLLFGKY